MRIDWDFIVDSYNKQKDSLYAGPRSLLHDLYKKHHNLGTLENILGVSAQTIAKEMDFLKIPRRHRRVVSRVKTYLLSQSKERLSTMNIHEILAEVGGHCSEVYKFLYRLGLKYKNINKVPRRR